MTTEFRRAHLHRTHIGDVFREPISGQLVVVTRVWQAGDYIRERVDGRYYRFNRGAHERTAVVALPRANKTWKREM